MSERNAGCNVCQGRYECMICLYIPSNKKLKKEPKHEFVFDNCNVCGRKLHHISEDNIGMCLMCAEE